MTPFRFSLLYFMFIQQNISSFIWFYCFFSICCTVCVCLEEVFFVKLFLLFSSFVCFVFNFLVFFFFSFFFFLVCLVCFRFFFLFHFFFVLHFFHLMESFVLSTFQCPSDSHFSLSSVKLNYYSA